MPSNKPKNPQVGVVDCPFHDDAMIVQARVMQSLPRGGKFYIACQSCGLIMPTLPNFQTWVKNNARFNKDIQAINSETNTRIQNRGDKEMVLPEYGEDKAAAPAIAPAIPAIQESVAKLVKATAGKSDKSHGAGIGERASDDNAAPTEKPTIKTFEDEMGF